MVVPATVVPGTVKRLAVAPETQVMEGVGCIGVLVTVGKVTEAESTLLVSPVEPLDVADLKEKMIK